MDDLTGRDKESQSLGPWTETVSFCFKLGLGNIQKALIS